MFFRVKPSGPRRYLQIVENHWHDGRSCQRVIATLGRLDHLQEVASKPSSPPAPASPSRPCCSRPCTTATSPR